MFPIPEWQLGVGCSTEPLGGTSFGVRQVCGLSGKVTGACLSQFASMLTECELQRDSFHEVVPSAIDLCLPRVGMDDRGAKESLLRVVCLFIIRGAATTYQRLHLPTQLFPLALFRVVDPSLDDGEAEAVFEEAS